MNALHIVGHKRMPQRRFLLRFDLGER